uniref:Uncharacterized protein n=1 Tax=Amphimedon queenslandica TaxID=400682 RepID=A0A1X7U7J7_AMPQE
MESHVLVIRVNELRMRNVELGIGWGVKTQNSEKNFEREEEKGAVRSTPQKASSPAISNTPTTNTSKESNAPDMKSFAVIVTTLDKRKELTELRGEIRRKNEELVKWKRYNNRERYCSRLEKEKGSLKRKIESLESNEEKRMKKEQDEIKRQEEEEAIKRRVRIEEEERLRIRARYNAQNADLALQSNNGAN